MKLFEKKTTKSNGKRHLSKEPSNTGPKGLDTLYARLRRLEARVNNLEAGLSTARRDINRIDRANYRKASQSPVAESEVFPGLSQKDIELLFPGG